jgi:transcriptional regulator with XRE-family HTH domain
MIKREELLKTEEYWFETLQNEIYRIVANYIEQEGMTQSQLAEKLGVTKGYISQIMNGNFNYTLKKLIELSLVVNKAPLLDFKNIEEYIFDDSQQRFEMKYSPFLSIYIDSGTTKIFPLKSTYTNTIENDSKIPLLGVG